MTLHSRFADGESRLTRRAVLSAGALSVAGLAGCTQLSGSSDDSSRGDDSRGADDAEAPEDRFPDAEDLFTDLDVLTLRFDTTEEVVERDDDAGVRRPYLLDEEDVDALLFTEEPIGGEDPFEFLSDIDYDEATGLVLSNTVDGCRQQQLVYVKRRSSGGLRVQFCRTYRDPDVQCSVDDQHTQITLAEVPVTFDRRPSGFGGGRSSACTIHPDHPANDEAGEYE